MTTRQYIVRFGGDASGLVNAGKQATTALGGVDAAAAGVTAGAARVNAAWAKTGATTGDAAFRVGRQVQDFSVQVAGGQNVALAFAQQFSQLSAEFGGTRGALAALGAMFTTTTVAIGAAAVAVGVLGYAYTQAQSRQAEFQRYLVLTGNSAGITAAEIDASAERIAASTRVSIATARELVVAYADTGKAGPEALEAVARATARLAQISGNSADDVRKQFDGLFDKPAAAALKLNERYNFLTADTAKLIVQLERQGKVEEAGKLVAEELDKALKARNTAIGTQIGLWERLGVAASNALNRISKSFDAPSTQAQTKAVLERIDAEKEALEFAEQRGNSTEVAGRKRAIEALTKQYHALFEVQKTEGQAALAAADAAQKAAQERAKVEQILKPDKPTTPRTPRGEPRDAFNDAQDKLEAQMRERLDRIADSEDAARAKQLAADVEAYRKRSEAGVQFGLQLQDQAAQISISLIADDEARGRAVIANERAVLLERLDALNLEADEYSRIWDATQTYIAARNAQLTEELKPEWQRQLEAWADTNRLMRDSFNSFQSGWLREGEDAWVQFAQTGKLNVKSLVDFAIAELARLSFRQNVAGGWSALGQAIGNYFTGGAGGGGVATNNTGTSLPTAGGMANGGAMIGGVRAFARGGIFGPNGGLTSGPTVFPMRNGMGLAGEAGTEAVMPLKRTASGKLGVIAQGGGAAEINIEVRNMPGQVSGVVSRRPNATGGADIVLQIREAVKADMIQDVQQGGPFMSALSGQTGASRTPGLVR